MFPRPIRIVGVVACVTAVACAPSADTDQAAQNAAEMPASQPAPAPLTQQEVEAASDAFTAAVRNGDTTALGNGYTSDAVFISARGKLEGNDAIAAFWKDAVKNGGGKSLEAQTVKFGSAGDIAWMLNTFTGGVTAPAGHTLRVFQRQPDGTVKTLVQLSIPDAPAK